MKLESSTTYDSLFLSAGSNLRNVAEIEAQKTLNSSSNEAAKAKVETNAFFSQVLLEKLQAKSLQLKNDRKQLKKMKNAYVDFAGHEVRTCHKAISQYSKQVDLKVHQGEGKAIDEDHFSGKYLFSAGLDKQVHAFNPATKKIEASISFKHKLTGLAVFHLNSNEDQVISIVVADDHKKIHLIHFNQDLKKFTSDFDFEFDENVHNLIIHPIGSLLFGLKKDKAWFVFDLEEVDKE